MSTPPDIVYTKALPKAELHAHFSGSVSKQCLHDIWTRRRELKECLDLEDPLTAIKAGEHGFVDLNTFFPLFDKYIYTLLDRLEWVTFALDRVLRDFADDGVQYLELRTTPRPVSGRGNDSYVRSLNEAIGEREREPPQESERMEVYLILSIDRGMSAEQAMAVVDQAIYHKYKGPNLNTRSCYVVGVDLCGNPAKGDVSIFTPAFKKAKDHGLDITVHFAEIPQSSSDAELEIILTWQPDRLGHCIHVSDKFKEMIANRGTTLELCLSCNVLAGLTTGGFDEHHFREWYGRDANAVALCTDDVGIFGSSLSEEYCHASKHFQLSRQQLLDLSHVGVAAAFADRGATERMLKQLNGFAAEHALRGMTTKE